MNASRTKLALCLTVAMTSSAVAQELTVHEKNVVSANADYSPFVDQHFPTRVFFGDTHLHTRNSPDAGFVGCTLGPEEAYRFARGEEVTSSGGLRAKLVRPLDFLVVADHAEYYGLASQLIDGDPSLLADPIGKRWYDMFNGSPEGGFNVFQEIIQSSAQAQPKELIASPATKRSAWERNTATAEQYNEPGRFTALIGFEWSSIASWATILHRVVIFQGRGRAGEPECCPCRCFDSVDPEHLWEVHGRLRSGDQRPNPGDSRTTATGATG